MSKIGRFHFFFLILEHYFFPFILLITLLPKCHIQIYSRRRDPSSLGLFTCYSQNRSPSPIFLLLTLQQCQSVLVTVTDALFSPTRITGLIQQPAQPPGPWAETPAIPWAPHRPHLWGQGLPESTDEESESESGGTPATRAHWNISYQHRWVPLIPTVYVCVCVCVHLGVCVGM